MSATRILMLGAPGAGKGTQAGLLADGLGVPHISTGEMLRDAVATGSAVGLQAKAVMEAGRLVSDEIVIAISEERLRRGDAQQGFVLDGFPRTRVQAEALDALLTNLAAPLQCGVSLAVDTDVVVGRLLHRAEIEGRSDDNEETIRERIKVYEEQTAPLLRYYRERGLVTDVDGMGSIQEVSQRVREVVARV